MSALHVLIEARPFSAFDPAPLEALRRAGFEISDLRGAGIAETRFREALARADILLCGNDLRVDDAVLDRAGRLRAVAKLGAGLDTVDVAAATRRRIPVFHTPGANNQAVADHTFALILALARRILECDRGLRAQRWEHTRILGVEIWQKTLGLVGLGAIGRCVALRAKGFQMRVLAHDPYWPEAFAAEHGIERVPLEELLARADIVSLHVPLTPESRHLIDARALARMKPSAFLINCSRGGIVNEAHLVEALRTGKIAGAGLDVFEEEPPVASPLLALDNVVLTPHTAAFTYEGMNNMSTGIVEQILAFARGERPRHTVNPEVFASA
ncbi:MAG: phosphoglycerate dehydrogenase [Desulfobacterales bacterium]